MRVMITGVTGFLGSALARHLVGQGHAVLGTSRRTPVQVKHLPADVKIEPLTLGGRISPGFFDDIDCVIHCAHDFSQDGLDRNIRGTKELFERAKASGTGKQAFVSSYSASENAVTSYGIAKYQLERFFSDRNSLILKPGLVLGPGGMSGNVLLAAQKWPIFPAPGGASARFPYVWLDDFVHIVTDAIESQRSGIVDVFYPEFTNLVELASFVRSETGRPFVICRVPLGLLSFGLNFLQTILRLFSMRLPDAAASVLSLRANQKGQINRNFQLLPYPSITLHEMVARSLRGLQARERFASR
jgi:nucleoside-diphosphate-sugar epimerase